MCLYRHAVADLVSSGRYQQVWREADTADALSAEPTRAQTWSVCMDAGYELAEWPEDDWPPELATQMADSARRVCLCFEQQMLAADERKIPRTVRKTLVDVLHEAGLG